MSALSPLQRAHKRAARLLIEKVGGFEAAEGFCRLRKSRLQQVCDTLNAANADAFMPADVIDELEAVAGEPVYTSFLANRQSYLLMPRPGADGVSAACLTVHLATIASESADTVRTLAALVTQAEAMSPPQLAAATAQARELCEAAGLLIQRLEAEGGLPPRIGPSDDAQDGLR
ncbi:MAG: hypothetical protein ACK4K7_03150 [Allosphingosinicella sp.]|uniref:hypothetical protein n=1 Tax=Allosphingosinicella sp. TaxID=2823234 RepID=UPI003931F4ED